MAANNELRLFISSTFRDLQEEREHLVKKIFPEIRALCRERGITFTEVDLRWGLTDEDVVLGQVIRTCLEEIDRCRPYFIGITGERYGYVPELTDIYKDGELLVRYPWIEEAAMQGASIMDMEFRHGALNDPEGAQGTARFFFRRQRPSLDPDAAPNAESEQLDRLRRQVRDAGLPVEEFRDPHSLGEMIYDELIEIIRRDFADATPPTPLAEERGRHAAFAASRRHAYIPNPDYLTRLNDWLAAETVPLVVYAESGSGKSSLVSFWCESLRRRRPELHIIEHYVGIGAGESDHIGIMRHVMEEIKERFDRSEEIPVRSEEIERDFANWLGFGLGAPMLLVIDGINQLSGRALDLHWIPPIMPAGVKMIITSTVEGTLVDLRSRGWETLGMQPLNEKEREAVIVRFLSEYHKALSGEQVRRIASDVKCAHPLFLRTLLEELRVDSRHETIDRDVSRYLETTGTEDLFQQVLARMEEDFGSRVVRQILSAISCSRFGLSEENLVEITGISRLKLTTILTGLDYHLVRKSGVLTFFHDYLRRAVEKRYLMQEGERHSIYEKIVEHFGSSEKDLRGTRELIHALERLGADDRLERALSDIPRFNLLWSPESREDVLQAWAGKSFDTIAEAYRRGMAEWIDRYAPEPEVESESLGNISGFYDLIGLRQEAVQVNLRRLSLVRAMENRAAETRVLSRLSNFCRIGGNLEEAENYAIAAEEIARALDDTGGIVAAVAARGHLYIRTGEYDRALKYLREWEEISRRMNFHGDVSAAIGNQGIVYYFRGEWDDAERCIVEWERLNILSGNRRGAALAVANRGNIYSARGRFREALECFAFNESVARELGDRRAITLSVGNSAEVHYTMGDFPAAHTCYDEQERLARETGDSTSLTHAVGNRGCTQHLEGNLSQAVLSLREAERLSRASGYSYGLRVWIEVLGQVLLEATQSFDELPPAFAEYRRATEEGTEWRADLLESARRLAEESADINRSLSNSAGIFDASILLARITAAEGNLAGAIEQLQSMAAKVPDGRSEKERAVIDFYLWKFGAQDTDHHSSACTMFRKLLSEVPRYEYRCYLQELGDMGPLYSSDDGDIIQSESTGPADVTPV